LNYLTTNFQQFNVHEFSQKERYSSLMPTIYISNCRN